MKTEITQQVKLAHSLNERQDVPTTASSPTILDRPSGLVKIAAVLGNYRSRTSAMLLGLAVLMGISSIPANYPDIAAAKSAQTTNLTPLRPGSSARSSSTDRYIEQLRSGVSQMQTPQPVSIDRSIAPRFYPSSVANRTDINTLAQPNVGVSIPLDVGAPKIKTFNAANSPSYYAPNNVGSDGEFNNPEDRLPTNGTGITTLGYSWPAIGTLTSRFGRRWGRMHKGIDIAGPIGTPINAAADGIVIAAGWNSGGYGNLVEIRHGDGTTTRYGHNSRLSVSIGQTVRQGQQVAQMGSTGHSTGSHLHFEIRPSGGSAVNPMAHLPANS